MSHVEVVPIDALSEDPEQQARLRAAIEMHTESSRAIWGDEHSGWTEDEVRGRRRGGTYHFVDRLAEVEGHAAGMCFMAMPAKDNPHLALLMLAVHPGHRRRGVGTALLEDALGTASRDGRTVVRVDTEWTVGGHDEHGEEFATRHDFVAAQTMTRSVMRLPAPRGPLQIFASGEGVEDAAAFAIEVAWEMPPTEWLDDLAVLEQRMSTDAPQGDTTQEEEAWDAARVAGDCQWAVDSGRRILTVVARDLSTGRLVGFTVLHVTAHDPSLAYQQDTLVLREARGYRLGVRLKAAAALELMDACPEVARIPTWNADDNTHMLAVNRDLGYEPEGYLRVWERRL
ncbi:GNAT family N-acetyltransferase [Demetria terragena]|uniref:GNAT family N-acetyltransferase n=1 Tax=Demetria terragena TaxID=63959 RepID=UPI00036DACFD|nr:GNAT family N-acetyltransferase [Demetria terragena]